MFWGCPTDGVDTDSPGISGGWNEHRSAQSFIALEGCGPVFLNWQKEEA